MKNAIPPQGTKLSNEEVIARAERAMRRASEKAMADYKRFGIEPVVAPFLQNNGKKAK
jgi:hypothetical protein